MEQYFDWPYDVTEDGQVISHRTSQPLKYQLNSKGYLVVGLRNKGKRLKKAVHRMVAEIYLGPIPEGYEVDHIDEDKTNPHKDNLQIIPIQKNKEKAHAKHWVVVDPSGKVHSIYNLAKFCREHDLDRTHMARVLRGEFSQHKGWTQQI